MQVFSYVQNGEESLGIAEGGNYYRLTGTSAGERLDIGKMEDLYVPEKRNRLIDIVSEIKALKPMSPSFKFLPCIPRPGKIICVGHNYRGHVAERHAELPREPVIFGKFPDSVAAHMDFIPIPRYSSMVDYEGELAFAVGVKCSDVPRSRAPDCILGYFPANDVSARDLQFRSSQWLLGKSCERFCPIGPCIYIGEIDPHSLDLKTTVNGETRQSASTADMIFDCYEILSYVSRYFTLYPGDIVLTGTPEGVIVGKPENERVWLKPGDRVEVSIEKLGTLTNTFTKLS